MHIDGSLGEGGGQILRTALALAVLLHQPVQIDNIRARRPQPGLKTQHLAGVLALARIADAEVHGARKHSTELVFMPRTIRGGSYRFEISTAGAAGMLFGAVLPPLIFAPHPSEVVITGGTHVPFSPPFHYLKRVFLPGLQKLGGEASLELERWGFYPRGGGLIRGRIIPCRGLQGLKLQKRGGLKRLELSACSSDSLPGHIARREIAYLETCLAPYRERVRVETVVCRAASPGNFVFLQAEYEHAAAGFSCLGKRGLPAEEVAREVCRSFAEFDKTAATVDSYQADQLILYAALAHGDSCFVAERITGHLLANIEIIRKFLPAVIDLNLSTGEVRVKGAGFAARV
jgi:RNA 3'-terminal phosphate cyclase (ATP)